MGVLLFLGVAGSRVGLSHHLACAFCCEFGCTSVTYTILAVVAFPPTHPFLSLPCRLFGADAPCLSMTLVYPQVSWSSYYMGIGMATTSAHIPLGMTTSQSIACLLLCRWSCQAAPSNYSHPWHPCCLVRLQ